MEANNELTLKDLVLKIGDIWSYLLPKWKIILLIVLIGAGYGLYKSLTSKPIYEANLQMILQEETQGGGGLSSLASSFGLGGSSNGLFSTPNMLEYLKTRKLIEKALLTEVSFTNKKMSYADYYLLESGWLDDWKENSKLKSINFKKNLPRDKFTRLQDSVLGLIYISITKTEYSVSQPDDKNGVILLQLKTQDEKFSKYFLEELESIVSDYYIESKIKKQKQTVNILEQQVDSVRSELYSAMIGAAAASDDIIGLNPSMNVKRVPSAKKQIDIQANSAILNELVKNLELSKMNLLNQTPLIEVIDKPVLPLEKKRLGKFKALVIGGFFGGLIAVIFLLFKRYLKSIKSEN